MSATVPKKEIKCLSIEELKAELLEMGEKPFRAGQIFKWLHEPVESFDEMSNLSKDLRARLAERFVLTVPVCERKQVSKVDGTRKYLWRMQGGYCVESVLMKYEHGNTVCVHAGRLPHGLQVLRVRSVRSQAQSQRGRNSGRGALHSEGIGRTGQQYRADGHGRTAG